jgi:hypothetical protein
MVSRVAVNPATICTYDFNHGVSLQQRASLQLSLRDTREFPAVKAPNFAAAHHGETVFALPGLPCDAWQPPALSPGWIDSDDD